MDQRQVMTLLGTPRSAILPPQPLGLRQPAGGLHRQAGRSQDHDRVLPGRRGHHLGRRILPRAGCRTGTQVIRQFGPTRQGQQEGRPLVNAACRASGASPPGLGSDLQGPRNNSMRSPSLQHRFGVAASPNTAKPTNGASASPAGGPQRIADAFAPSGDIHDSARARPGTHQLHPHQPPFVGLRARSHRPCGRQGPRMPSDLSGPAPANLRLRFEIELSVTAAAPCRHSSSAWNSQRPAIAENGPSRRAMSIWCGGEQVLGGEPGVEAADAHSSRASRRPARVLQDPASRHQSKRRG